MTGASFHWWGSTTLIGFPAGCGQARVREMQRRLIIADMDRCKSDCRRCQKSCLLQLFGDPTEEKESNMVLVVSSQATNARKSAEVL
jgi:hypothetical protein